MVATIHSRMQRFGPSWSNNQLFFFLFPKRKETHLLCTEQTKMDLLQSLMHSYLFAECIIQVNIKYGMCISLGVSFYTLILLCKSRISLVSET